MIRTQVNNDLHGQLSFVGTLDECAQQAEYLRANGVDEIACLIDFGIGIEDVMLSLRRLSLLVEHEVPALQGTVVDMRLPVTSGNSISSR
jgi:hypothetical protein